MNALLERLGRFAGRHRWWVIGVWVLLLAGLTLANRTEGGNFVNDYTVPGSQSSTGLDTLRKDFKSASGYSGQIVFNADKGKVSDESKAVATTMKNVGALPHVLSATDPLKTKNTPAVSKNGKIAYGSVSWDVAPASLDADYLDSLDDAVDRRARPAWSWSTAAARARSARRRTTPCRRRSDWVRPSSCSSSCSARSWRR